MSSFKTAKLWRVINGAIPEHLSFSPETRAIPAQILTILANRGLTEPTEIRKFLSPSLEQLPAPQLLKGLDLAVAILAEAREKQIPVLIHGDYDADGVTATALLVRFFREIGLPVCYHLPDRINEGYGLNLESLASLRNLPVIAEHPAPILLTVDCGITSIDEISAAKVLGFRVIVTDHHQPNTDLPDAEAIINPHQPGCEFPFRDLAGVGVAFYLAAGLRSELVRRGVWVRERQPNLKKYLDLVAIGTVADMVPVREVNRILVKIGLEIINHKPGPGLKALLKQIGQGTGNVSAETIAFQLAPRLNAAGRIGSAKLALQLLLTEDESIAQKLAEGLGQSNRLRKELSEEMYTQARIQADRQRQDGRVVLVVSGEGWHQGVAGLVAARLVRDFCRPAVVLAVDKAGVAKGSVRSVENFDILACLRECSVHLDSCGGHRVAAGVSLKSANIEIFHAALDNSVSKTITQSDTEPRLEIDLAADPHEIMQEGMWNYLQQLEPFGNGNPEPIFCCRAEGIRLTEIKKVGAESFRFRIQGSGKGFAGIGFGMASWVGVAEREPLRLAYKIIRNNFRGAEQWEIQLEDMQLLT